MPSSTPVLVGPTFQSAPLHAAMVSHDEITGSISRTDKMSAVEKVVVSLNETRSLLAEGAAHPRSARARWANAPDAAISAGKSSGPCALFVRGDDVLAPGCPALRR